MMMPIDSPNLPARDQAGTASESKAARFRDSPFKRRRFRPTTR
jgi:hypothetical protein